MLDSDMLTRPGPRLVNAAKELMRIAGDSDAGLAQ